MLKIAENVVYATGSVIDLFVTYLPFCGTVLPFLVHLIFMLHMIIKCTKKGKTVPQKGKKVTNKSITDPVLISCCSLIQYQYLEKPHSCHCLHNCLETQDRPNPQLIHGVGHILSLLPSYCYPFTHVVSQTVSTRPHE